MSKKRPALGEAVGMKAALEGAKSEPPTQPAKAQKPETPTSGSKVPPSRENTVYVAGYFDPEVRKQLKVLAAEEERPQQALLGEALNLLFEKYGKPPIAGQ